MKYYILKTGVRCTDDDGSYIEPMSKSEAEECVDEGVWGATEYMAVDRFNKIQGY